MLLIILNKKDTPPLVDSMGHFCRSVLPESNGR
jgi:hypothetical protein